MPTTATHSRCLDRCHVCLKHANKMILLTVEILEVERGIQNRGSDLHSKQEARSEYTKETDRISAL